MRTRERQPLPNRERQPLPNLCKTLLIEGLSEVWSACCRYLPRGPLPTCRRCVFPCKQQRCCLCHLLQACRADCRSTTVGAGGRDAAP